MLSFLWSRYTKTKDLSEFKARNSVVFGQLFTIQLNRMKNFENFKHQKIDHPQTIKGGHFIRRGKIKKKPAVGYKPPTAYQPN
ncbi:hypothetical protein BKI52_08515 [marine bacterium AO1-C]|nr:hypothetical protein BKI52_08515 [marine bacterium AO1-C]